MELRLEEVDASSVAAQWAMRQYLAELDARIPEGFDVEGALATSAADYHPPAGAFVLATRGEETLGCGAVHFLDDDRGEIKRMWVSPAARGQGLASQLLARLEDHIRASGRRTAVLDTNRELTEAVSLYARRGYVAIERYNDNPHAHHWFRKDLSG